MFKTSNTIQKKLLTQQSLAFSLKKQQLNLHIGLKQVPKQIGKTEFKRISIMSQQLLGRRLGSGMLGNSMPKRMFNSSVDKIIMRVVERMPQGNLGFGIAAINAIIYSLYLVWPSYNMYSFMNNFTFSMYGLNKGHFWNLLTCHFSHMSFISFLLDSGIIWLFCQNLSMMYGPLYVGRTLLLSLILGSLFVFVH